MSAATLSQDVVGVCLVLADGDTNMDLEEVIVKAERFQKAQSRHFGITQEDLRGLFAFLFFWELGSEHRLVRHLGHSLWKHNFKGIRLHEIIPIVLQYHDAYFNDESEYWCGKRESSNPPGTTAGEDSIDRYFGWYGYGRFDWYGYSREEYLRRVQMKQEMSRFFSEQDNPSHEATVQFMRTHGLDDRLLYHCSRPGECS